MKAITLHNKEIEFDISKAIFRPAIYGIVLDGKNILLVNVKDTGKYFFPGGGIELGEDMESALIREIKEETGVDAVVEKNLTFTETFAYYNPHDVYYQTYAFYYVCKPLTKEIVLDNPDLEDQATEAYWLNLDDLTADQFQYPANKIFPKIKDLF